MNKHMIATLLTVLLSFSSTRLLSYSNSPVAIGPDFVQYPVGEIHHIIGKIKASENWTLVMDDDTIWLVKEPPFEGQSWSEWWNGQEHKQSFPKYYFNFSERGDNMRVQIYEYVWENEIAKTIFKGDEKEAKNLLNYPFLIQDLHTGETLFARRLSGNNLVKSLKNLIKGSYDQGHSVGYSAGYSAGLNEGQRRSK